MGVAIARNVRCPKCSSSDGLTVFAPDDRYSHVNGHCYACLGNFKEHQLEEYTNYDNVTTLIENTSTSKAEPIFLKGTFRDLKGEGLLDRGISVKAAQRFGVQVTDDGRITFPYFSPEGKFVAQKVRSINAPKGYWIGDHKNTGFFGMNLWKSGKKLTLTEGEADSLAAYEMFGGDFPVISVRDGACKTGQKIVNQIRDNYDYFKGFEEIILCFDNDEAGKISAEAAAKILPAGKVRIMRMDLHKDANDYLRAGHTKEFIKEFWAAPIYTPAGIVAGVDLWELVSTKEEYESVDYPWEKLNKITYGFRLHEMITIVAGSGQGKTVVMKELAAHILEKTTANIGLIMLEESVKRTALGLMSVRASKPLHMPDVECSANELRDAYNATVGSKDDQGRPRVYLYDHFGSTDIDSIIGAIEHLARAGGCKYIMLDHISIMVSDQANGDERKALDEAATKLRTCVQENDLCLFLVSHLRRPASKPHEEGGHTSLADIRGTAGIGQLSDFVIGLERDGQAEDKFVRNTTKVRVLKNRFCGLTGVTSSLYYDAPTGRLTEIKEAEKTDDESPTTRKT